MSSSSGHEQYDSYSTTHTEPSAKRDSPSDGSAKRLKAKKKLDCLSDIPDEPPDISTGIVVGTQLVATTDVRDGNDVIKMCDVVKTYSWLSKALKLHDLYCLPHGNVLDELEQALAFLRGKRTRTFYKVDKAGKPLQSVVRITVRDQEVLCQSERDAAR